MASRSTQRISFRRRREGKTNYKKRLNLLRGRTTRMVVRPTLNHTVVQMVNYDEKGDKVLVSATTGQLRELGWTFGTGNTPAAYLAGLLAGKRAAKANIRKAVLDMGLSSPVRGSRTFASLKGAVDAGMDIPHSGEVLPSDDRLKGLHIKKPELTKNFEEIKQKILKI